MIEILFLYKELLFCQSLESNARFSMLDHLCIPHLPSGLMVKISAILGVITLALCLAFCWHQWKMVRAYGQFPSKRLDIEWLLPFILGRYPKDVPFTNVLFQIILKSVRMFQKEGLCVLWFLKPYVLVFNEEYIKDLVNDVALADKSTLYDTNNLFLGNGLIGSKHEVWKVHRKLLYPAFGVGVLKSKMTIFNKYALQMVEKLETHVGKPVDNVREVLKYCAFQNMAAFLFDLDLNNEKHESFVENIMKTVDSAEKLMMEKWCCPWYFWNFLLNFSKWGRYYLETLDVTNRLVREMRDEMIKKNALTDNEQQNEDSCRVIQSCCDILTKLYLQDSEFTEQDVRDHLVNFISAGYDTIASSMLWCFYALGHHPDVQEKAFHEVQSLVPEGDVTYEDLGKLKYLDCVIKESHRLHPPVPGFARKSREEIQCGKYIIPKGAEVCIFHFMLHRDPNNFPDPERFDPERFYEGSKLNQWTYIPFAEGYRSCTGKRFAMVEMKVQLVHVLRLFRITSLNKISESELDFRVVLKSIKPVRLLFEKRY